MQRFQQIVQRAIQNNIHRLKLTAGVVPAVISSEGPFLWEEAGKMDAQYIQSLFKVFFPEGVGPNPERGQWDIPDMGTVMLIAEPGLSPTLKLYFPSGKNMFEMALLFGRSVQLVVL